MHNWYSTATSSSAHEQSTAIDIKTASAIIEKMLNSSPYKQKQTLLLKTQPKDLDLLPGPLGYECCTEKCLNEKQLLELIGFLNEHHIKCQTYQIYSSTAGVYGGIQFTEFQCQDDLIHALHTIYDSKCFDKHMQDSLSVLHATSVRCIIEKIFKCPQQKSVTGAGYAINCQPTAAPLTRGEVEELIKFLKKNNCSCEMMLDKDGKIGLLFEQFETKAEVENALNTACPKPKNELVHYGIAD